MPFAEGRTSASSERLQRSDCLCRPEYLRPAECAACHGELGVSTSSLIPMLAGMDAAAIYKQLDDHRSGKRLWGVMGAIAKALSAQDSADVAAHFAAQPGGVPPLSGNRIPESGRRLREPDPPTR